MPGEAPSRKYLTRLRQLLGARFAEGELRTFCFDLGLDYDDLPGEGREDKAREIVAYMARHARLPDLVSLGRERRPDIPWEEAAEGRFEFVNRENELNLLHVERLRATRSPYTLVGAPAGYGKTYLFQRLMRMVESDDALAAKWRIRYVDLTSHPLGAPQIAQAITGGDTLPPDSSVDTICSYIVRELSAPLPDGRRAVLLIFDAVERLGDAARQWLYDLLDDLRRRTRSGYQDIITVRVIAGGRDVESFWEEYERTHSRPPAPQRIYLTPFGAHSIQELIWSQAQATRVPLDDQTVGQIACEVEHLSGGHPAVIYDVVSDLALQSFAIGPAREYFEQHRTRLARAYLAPVAADLLESMDAATSDAVRAAVRALSVFRRVNANTVQALIAAGVLLPETDEIDLLGQMHKAHLLSGPGIREPFYRDHLMRRIWAQDMACGSPEDQAQYRRLNAIALALYRDWIRNLGQGLPDTPLKATQRLLSVVEWLFHALQDEELSEETLRRELQEHIRAVSAGDESPAIAALIADEIRQDGELCYLLRRRLGEEGVAAGCRWLEEVQNGEI